MESLDLSNLRDMTGGDADLEKQLFQMFIESTQAGLAALSDGWQPGKEDLWRKQSHALKGLAFNLGAIRMGEICKEAQDSFAAASEKKQALFAAMQGEFANVKGQLEKLLKA